MDFDGERMVCFGGRSLGGPTDRVAEATGDGWWTSSQNNSPTPSFVLLPSAAYLESLIYFGTAPSTAIPDFMRTPFPILFY
jgi:hypothetical protein